MRIQTLINLLQEHFDLLGDVEVRLMQQPAWPMEYSIHNVVNTRELTEKREDVVFIVEGAQLAYGDKKAWEDL